jgi:hypothetical protein
VQWRAPTQGARRHKQHYRRNVSAPSVSIQARKLVTQAFVTKAHESRYLQYE